MDMYAKLLLFILGKIGWWTLNLYELLFWTFLLITLSTEPLNPLEHDI